MLQIHPTSLEQLQQQLLGVVVPQVPPSLSHANTSQFLVRQDLHLVHSAAVVQIIVQVLQLVQLVHGGGGASRDSVGKRVRHV
jgi:hypothetical protein